MQQIPLKNYIILGLIYVATIIVAIYSFNVYSYYAEYESNTTIRMDFLREINDIDFENYIIENPEMILYISDSDDVTYEKLEKDLKKSLRKKEYLDDIVYLNSKDLDSNFLKTLNKYADYKIENLPNVIIFEEGKVNDTLYFDSETTKKNVVSFMEQVNIYD